MTPESVICPEAGFMVSVQGASAPNKVHPTVREACLEAERLAVQPSNAGRIVRVLKVVATLRPKHVWDPPSAEDMR